jgi:NADPH:quinone reductase-like Zn-dependent oxidoreductase
MPVDARSFWTVQPGRGEIRSEQLPAAREGEVLVRTLYSGISRGTESLVFAGHVPVSEYGRMRAPFQAGDFPAPVKYGYASVGVIEAGAADLAGRTVFVLHPHQTRYVVPRASVHVVPDGVPPRRAVLAANLETAINGLWDARPHLGDRIVIVGGGAVGCLVAWLASRLSPSTVQLVDVNPARKGVATALGVSFAPPESAQGDADVVVHASGTAAGLQTAIALAGFEATVLEMSWYGDRHVPVALGESFHAQRLTIKSSQVGHVAASQRARWTTQRRMQLALSLLSEPALDTLITGESGFDDLPTVMAALAESPGTTLCHRIRYVDEGRSQESGVRS